MFRRRESNDRRKDNREQRYLQDENDMYSRRKRGRDSSESDGSDYSDRKHRSSRGDRHRHRSRDKYDKYRESSKDHKDKFGRNRDISSHRSRRRSSEKDENCDRSTRKRNKSGDYDEIPRRSFEKSSEIEENQRMVWDKNKLKYVKLGELDPEQRQRYEETPEFKNRQPVEKSADFSVNQRRSADLESNPKQNDDPAIILNKPHDSSVEFIDENPRKLPLPANNEKSRSHSSSRNSQEGEYNSRGYNYDDKYSETAGQYNHHSRESSQQQQDRRQSRWGDKNDSYYNKRQSFGGYERNQRPPPLGSGKLDY